MIANVSRIKFGITINIGISAKIQKNITMSKRVFGIWNPATCSCKNGDYLAYTIIIQ